MARYSVFGNAGAASTTAATAGLSKIDNPASATMASARLSQVDIGAQANSADNNYGVRLKRQSTAGTWTAVTPSPAQAALGGSTTLAGVASTAAGTGGVELWRSGYHMRGGLKAFFYPGSEFCNPFVFSNGIILEFVFAQGTDVQNGNLLFDE